MTLRDEDCDPDLLKIGLRAPKLTGAQRIKNRYLSHNHGGWKPPPPPPPIDPTVRRAAREDNYDRIRGVGIDRGHTTRRK